MKRLFNADTFLQQKFSSQWILELPQFNRHVMMHWPVKNARLNISLAEKPGYFFWGKQSRLNKSLKFPEGCPRVPTRLGSEMRMDGWDLEGMELCMWCINWKVATWGSWIGQLTTLAKPIFGRRDPYHSSIPFYVHLPQPCTFTSHIHLVTIGPLHQPKNSPIVCTSFIRHMDGATNGRNIE